MEQFSEFDLTEAGRAILSALIKSEKAILKLKENSPLYRLTAESIRAFQIALPLLRREQGAQQACAFGREDLARAGAALASARSRVQKVLPKFAGGTPQHTLAVRRIRAFTIAERLIQTELEQMNI